MPNNAFIIISKDVVWVNIFSFQNVTNWPINLTIFSFLVAILQKVQLSCFSILYGSQNTTVLTFYYFYDKIFSQLR
jgi:hypothetical protein